MSTTNLKVKAWHVLQWPAGVRRRWRSNYSHMLRESPFWLPSVIHVLSILTNTELWYLAFIWIFTLWRRDMSFFLPCIRVVTLRRHRFSSCSVWDCGNGRRWLFTLSWMCVLTGRRSQRKQFIISGFPFGLLSSSRRISNSLSGSGLCTWERDVYSSQCWCSELFLWGFFFCWSWDLC